MSLIAEEHTFAVLSVTRFEIDLYVAPYKNAQKWPIFVDVTKFPSKSYNSTIIQCEQQ